MLLVMSLPLAWFLLGMCTSIFSLPAQLRKPLQIPAHLDPLLSDPFLGFSPPKTEGFLHSDFITLLVLDLCISSLALITQYAMTFLFVCHSCYSVKSRRAEMGCHSSVFPQT